MGYIMQVGQCTCQCVDVEAEIVRLVGKSLGKRVFCNVTRPRRY